MSSFNRDPLDGSLSNDGVFYSNSTELSLLTPINVRNEYQQLPNETLKMLQQNLSNDVSLLLCNVRTGGNISMIVRHACLLGFKEIIICGRKHYDKRFTVGAHNYVPIEYVDSILNVSITCQPKTNLFNEKITYFPNEFVKILGDRTPVFLEQGGTDIREVPWNILKNVIIIVGNESVGIPTEFINDIKKLIPKTLTVSIPQWSVMRSMNCAMALATIMWEIRRKS